MAKLCAIFLMTMAVGGCLSVGTPGRRDLADALQVPSSNLRRSHCSDISEEPTEFACRYERRDADGTWRRWQVMLAIDGTAWVIIDGPGPVSD